MCSKTYISFSAFSCFYTTSTRKRQEKKNFFQNHVFIRKKKGLKITQDILEIEKASRSMSRIVRVHVSRIEEKEEEGWNFFTPQTLSLESCCVGTVSVHVHFLSLHLLGPTHTHVCTRTDHTKIRPQ